MRLLLDTQLLIWALARTARLSEAARAAINEERAERLFSAASIWEIGIKFALGRPDFTLDPQAVLGLAIRAGFLELPVSSVAAAGVATLPLHHRDPFDRLLVAQAIAEGAILLTVDTALAPYGSHVRLLGPAPGRVPHP